MSALRRDLLERKLWIVVAILIVGVVAVPVFLLKGASASTTPTVPVPPAAAAPGSQTATTSQTHSAEPAKVMLARIARDPFASAVPKLSSKPAPQSSSTPTATASATPSTATATPAASTATPTPASGSPANASMVSPSPATGSSSSATSSGSGGAGSSTTTTTGAGPTSTVASAPPSTTTTTPRKVRSWTIYSVSIRFGKNSAPVHKDIPRLTALPSAGNPQVMFFGVMSGGRQAVFGLGAGVAHAGPGLCRPSRTSCSAIVLSAGESEELAWPTATGGMAQAFLKVTKITSRITHSRAEALKAYRRVSAAGICDLSLAEPVLYDPDTGTVQSFPKGACKAQASSAPFAFLKTAR